MEREKNKDKQVSSIIFPYCGNVTILNEIGGLQVTAQKIGTVRLEEPQYVDAIRPVSTGRFSRLLRNRFLSAKCMSCRKTTAQFLGQLVVLVPDPSEYSHS